MSVQCKLEAENEKLNAENKELRTRCFDLQLALIHKETLALSEANIKLDMPKWFYFFKWLYKGDIHMLIDKKKLVIWMSSHWGRSWEI